jgi:Mrp family chromosome partitioning ATPase
MAASPSIPRFRLDAPGRESDAPDAGLINVRPTAMQAAVQAVGSVLNEEFRLLAARVRIIDESTPFRVIGIVSAVPGEGKTTVALGLAATLARATRQRVLLVEADLRKPSIEKYLGLPRARGVSDWLAGSAMVLPVRTLANWSVGLLPAGKTALESMDALGSARMGALIAAGRERFSYVILDCPPLMPVADAVVLQDYVDGMLMVVRAGQVRPEALARAGGRLKPDRIRGLVFVDEPEILAKDYTYGHRRYAGYGQG